MPEVYKVPMVRMSITADEPANERLRWCGLVQWQLGTTMVRYRRIQAILGQSKAPKGTYA